MWNKLGLDGIPDPENMHDLVSARIEELTKSFPVIQTFGGPVAKSDNHFAVDCQTHSIFLSK